MKVLKFGGTSVADAAAIKQVISILQHDYQSISAVIVSACSGITDKLIRACDLAAAGQPDYQAVITDIRAHHHKTAAALLEGARLTDVVHYIDEQLDELANMLHGVVVLHEITLRTRDFVLSFGERLSAFIIARAMDQRGTPAGYLDARIVVKTDDNFSNARVNIDTTYRLITDYFSKNPGMQIVTGFIGTTARNETTTLGRGGSDYSASLFGAALNSDEVEIWTDVNGVLTANPKLVPAAFPVDALSYEEAMEMSHFGAKVIYSATMQPAREKNIPIRIRNTFEPSFAGTVIGPDSGISEHLVKGITAIGNIGLLTVQGSGMVGVTGIAGRLFSALARHQISIILITQASSEHSISFAVAPGNIDDAARVVQEEFKLEMQVHWIDDVIVQKDLSIVAVVGERMKHRPGIAGRVFSALGKAGVNVVAIAQGSSELNISAVISGAEESHALRALHSIFFSPDKTILNIYLVGTGLIGKELLSQIAALPEAVRNRLRVCAAARSKKMVLNKNGIPPQDADRLLEVSGTEADLERIVNEALSHRPGKAVFVDCTASDIPVPYYKRLLAGSVHVVTPNKRANAAGQSEYDALRTATSQGNVQFNYETNVGAALPVISTIADLRRTGDEIESIEALVSGSLSFIFNSYDGSQPFSAIVRTARDNGFTEPDPRDDLGGMDVARKILILARESGYQLEPGDVQVESLIPSGCADAADAEKFLTCLSGFDDDFARQSAKAHAAGKRLRYLARFDGKKAEVKLQAVGPENPFYQLSGSDNMIVIRTRRYHEQPLVIRGPGAGAALTASGVLNDILKIMK
jgi:aspartokinase/homoserine dehydrogenase 1